MTLGEVGVSLPWWCYALVLLDPSYWRFFKSYNFSIMEKLPVLEEFYVETWNFSNFTLWNFKFLLWPKISLKLVIFPSRIFLRFKKVFTNLEPEGQGSGIIMGVTRLLLLGPFNYIQTNFLYFFAHDCMNYDWTPLKTYLIQRSSFPFFQWLVLPELVCILFQELSRQFLLCQV